MYHTSAGEYIDVIFEKDLVNFLVSGLLEGQVW